MGRKSYFGSFETNTNRVVVVVVVQDKS